MYRGSLQVPLTLPPQKLQGDDLCLALNGQCAGLEWREAYIPPNESPPFLHCKYSSTTTNRTISLICASRVHTCRPSTTHQLHHVWHCTHLRRHRACSTVWTTCPPGCRLQWFLWSQHSHLLCQFHGGHSFVKGSEQTRQSQRKMAQKCVKCQD